MALVAGFAATRTSRSLSPARFGAWHPEWWVYAVTAGAWLALVLTAGAPDDGGSAPVHQGHAHGSAAAGPESLVSAWTGAWAHSCVMATAMMLPVVAPQVRAVAMRSLWSRRHRSAVAFVFGYLAVWAGSGAVALVPLVALDAYPLGTPWLVPLLLAAAGWQVSAPRRRLLRRCASLRLGPATGRAADLNCAAAGVRSGARCLATCGPLMLVMLASHSLVLMAGLLVVLLTERGRGPDSVSRAGRPLEAWAIAGFAAVAGFVALV